jgi:hypothetical protein
MFDPALPPDTSASTPPLLPAALLAVDGLPLVLPVLPEALVVCCVASWSRSPGPGCTPLEIGFFISLFCSSIASLLVID